MERTMQARMAHPVKLLPDGYRALNAWNRLNAAIRLVAGARNR
ncbi:hypothetical protein GCM10020216_051110 [Nonomuraea helvata]